MQLFRLAVFAALAPAIVQAADTEILLTINQHRFDPAEVRVPANQKIKLVVQNLDATPEEFESHALNREKVISGNSKATLYIGPLSPGRYPFFGEFHEQSAKGVVVAQ